MNSNRRKFLSSSCLGMAALPALAAPPTLISATSDFPAPKFQIGQFVLAVWEGDAGTQYTPALIIGMAYSPTNHKPGWSYLPRWMDNTQCPWSNGMDDGDLWHEQWLLPMGK